MRNATSSIPLAIAVLMSATATVSAGNADVVWRNTSTGANTVWRSADNRTPLPVAAVANASWRIVGVGDFDYDFRADLLWRNSATGANAIWRSGNNATPLPIAGVGNTAWKVAGVGDFDGDRFGDIVWRNDATGANTIWRKGHNGLPMPVRRTLTKP